MSVKKYLLGSGFLLSTAFSIYFATASGAQTAVQALPAHTFDYEIGAVLYQQKEAEYRALAYQAYNLARLRLDQDLDKKSLKGLPKAERKMPRAIVVDIDETVLD